MLFHQNLLLYLPGRSLISWLGLRLLKGLGRAHDTVVLFHDPIIKPTNKAWAMLDDMETSDTADTNSYQLFQLIQDDRQYGLVRNPEHARAISWDTSESKLL